MKQRKVPMRMCLGCQEMKPKKELIRVVKNKENEISIDLTGKKPGRGAYICNEILCFQKAQKAKKFERTFEIPIDDEIYKFLEQQLGGSNYQ